MATLDIMTPLGFLLLVFLPMVSHGRDECSIDRVKEMGVSPTSVTIAWSYECPEDKLNIFKFYVEHQDYNACDDKTKNVKLLVPKERDVSAREVTIYGLQPFSRYNISVKAVPKRNMNMKSVESSIIEVITPQSLPTLRIEEMKVVEAQATKLGFTWARLNLHHPRVVLKQSDCEQFESRLGQLHYKLVETSEGVLDPLLEGVLVRDGNLSLSATSLEVEGLTADTEYSIGIFATNPQGRYDPAAGSTVSARTLTASHDMTMVVVGIIVGIILIVFLVVIYVFLRRHGLPQRRKPLPRVETGVYSADRPILRTPRADVVRPYSESSTSGRKSMEDRPLPPRPGKPEPIYQEIPANGLKAPLAKEEEEEYDEAKFDDGEETGFLQPRAPTPSSVTEEDEDGYLKPNFHRFQSTEKGDDDGVPAPIPMISYGSSQDPLRT